MLVTRWLGLPDWPDAPFAFISRVPLSLTEGYTFQGGMPQKGEVYVSYCMTNGVFRTEPFPEASLLTLSNAIEQLLASPQWEAINWTNTGPGTTWYIPLNQNLARDLKLQAERSIRSQLENMLNPRRDH